MSDLKLTKEVRYVLQNCAVSGKSLVLPEKLDRKLYLQVNKALELLGGKWNRKAKAHLFEDDAADVVADAVASGTVLDFKKAFQFFETPSAVAARLCELADLQPGQTVLEPSAGRGALIREIRKHGIEPFACELWEKNRAVLAAAGVQLVGFDFLDITVPVYDRIVANPPFTRGQDVQHVLHMYELLKPGGKLVSVMGMSWSFRTGTRFVDFRKFMIDTCATWEALPEGSFSESGTSVRTGIVTIKKGAP